MNRRYQLSSAALPTLAGLSVGIGVFISLPLSCGDGLSGAWASRTSTGSTASYVRAAAVGTLFAFAVLAFGWFAWAGMAGGWSHGVCSGTEARFMGAVALAAPVSAIATLLLWIADLIGRPARVGAEAETMRRRQ